MSKRRGWSGDSAALRAAASAVTAAAGATRGPDVTDGGVATKSSAVGLETATGRGEYLMLSVWDIDPAPFQPRVVFTGISELAESIAGTPVSEGVGVLKPVLVRPVAGGRYQLIDGERRLRACRLLAERRPDRRYEIPARVFQVSEPLARVMGQVANLSHLQMRAVEIAQGYQRIREVLKGEGQTTGVRTVAEFSPYHGKSSVGKYLQVATALLDPEVLAGAGLLGDDCKPDLTALAQFELKDLLPLAKLATPQERARELKARVERARSGDSNRPIAREPQLPMAPAERLERLRVDGGLAIRIREPLQMMDPAAAREVLQNEITPAALGLAERGCRSLGGAGYLGIFAQEHVVLVLPGEVEGLALDQAEMLQQQLADLRRRVDRVVRFRQPTRRRSAAAAADAQGEAV